MFYYYIGSITDYLFFIPTVKNFFQIIYLFFSQVGSAAALSICLKFSNVHFPQADRSMWLVEILVLIG